MPFRQKYNTKFRNGYKKLTKGSCTAAMFYCIEDLKLMQFITPEMVVKISEYSLKYAVGIPTCTHEEIWPALRMADWR